MHNKKYRDSFQKSIMKRLKQVLMKVLEIKEQDITETTSPDTVASWDSFNALMLVSELEDAFGVSFTIDEVLSVTCVRDIKKCLMAHGVVFDES